MSMSNDNRRHSRTAPGLIAFVLAGSLVGAAWQGMPGQGAGGQGQGQAAGQGRGGTQTPPATGQAPGTGRAGAQGQAPQPARDNLAQPVGTGSITGAVVLSGAGTPVRRARVNLNGAELRGGRSTTTDDQGRFSFVSLPAGRFTMTASKPGFVSIAYGAKKPGRAGTPIQLAEGQKLEKTTINMPKGSVVTGVVIDENGEPSPQTQVRVMRFVTQTGEKTLQQAGTDQTDDRGVYRIYGLQPGDYIVSAIPRSANLSDLTQTVMAQVESLVQQAQAAGGGGRGGGGGVGGGLGAAGGPGGLANLLGGRGGRGQQFLDQASQLQQQLQQQQTEQTVGYAPVYFPGTTLSGSAAAVTLSVGEERPGIDFQLQLVPTARIDGTISSPDGTLPPGTQIMLAPAGQQNMPTIPGVSTNTTRVDQTGKFSFSNVTPGQYTLMARAAIRDPGTDGAAGQRQGRGGRGGPGGAISQVLWA
jgi:protocatechuate 3,4-dioxygenase beta subunit